MFSLIANFIMAMIICMISRKDKGFIDWRRSHKHSKRCIQCVSLSFSFKFSKMFYSKFLGWDNFNARFDSPGGFQYPLFSLSLCNALTTLLPIILADILGLIILSWGT